MLVCPGPQILGYRDGIAILLFASGWPKLRGYQCPSLAVVPPSLNHGEDGDPGAPCPSPGLLHSTGEISASLAMQETEVQRRGSRHRAPPVALHNLWDQQSPRASPSLQAHSSPPMPSRVSLRTQRWSPWHSLSTGTERERQPGSTPSSSVAGEDGLTRHALLRLQLFGSMCLFTNDVCKCNYYISFYRWSTGCTCAHSRSARANTAAKAWDTTLLSSAKSVPGR